MLFSIIIRPLIKKYIKIIKIKAGRRRFASDGK